MLAISSEVGRLLSAEFCLENSLKNLFIFFFAGENFLLSALTKPSVFINTGQIALTLIFFSPNSFASDCVTPFTANLEAQ